MLLSLMVCGAIAALAGAAAAEETREKPWQVTANAFLYILPEQDNFVMLTAPADFRRLHFEARYNYEALRSGSAFVGVNGSWGDELRLRVTPMIGGVFGALDGLVPALRWTVTWWVLDLYSESEVVVDFDEPEGSFFYNWSELGFSPLDWFRAGLVVQRNRVLMSPLDLQRGFFVSGRIGAVTASFYEFNLLWTTPTWVLALGATF